MLGFIVALSLRAASRHWCIQWSLRVVYGSHSVLRVNYVGVRYVDLAIRVFHGPSLGDLGKIVLEDDSPVKSLLNESEKREGKENKTYCAERCRKLCRWCSNKVGKLVEYGTPIIALVKSVNYCGAFGPKSESYMPYVIRYAAINFHWESLSVDNAETFTCDFWGTIAAAGFLLLCLVLSFAIPVCCREPWSIRI